MATLDLRLGATPAHLPFLNDYANCLAPRVRVRLRKYLETFSSRFHQGRIHLFFMDLRSEMNIREYGFWLHNRCRLNSAHTKLGSSFSVLLLIDPLNKRASVSVGYGCESFSTDEDWLRVLEAAAPAFAEEKWETGVRAFVKSVSRLFDKASRNAASALNREKVQVQEDFA